VRLEVGAHELLQGGLDVLHAVRGAVALAGGRSAGREVGRGGRGGRELGPRGPELVGHAGGGGEGQQQQQDEEVGHGDEEGGAELDDVGHELGGGEARARARRQQQQHNNVTSYTHEQIKQQIRVQIPPRNFFIFDFSLW
jgi:hypothetical protein